MFLNSKTVVASWLVERIGRQLVLDQLVHSAADDARTHHLETISKLVGGPNPSFPRKRESGGPDRVSGRVTAR